MFDHFKNGIIDPRFRQFIHLFLVQFFERSMAINTTFQPPIEIIKFVISITMDNCIPVLDAYILNREFKNKIKGWRPVECPCKLGKTYIAGVGFIDVK